jgi:uncharacterized protein
MLAGLSVISRLPMRRFLMLIILAVLSHAATAQSVFINEIHYDNTGTDVGEFIEVAGAPGTDLTGWSIVLYNGSGGAPYGTIGLSGTLPTSCTGLGVQSTAIAGIQNGAPDGMALVDDMGAVVQFLSYEGAFTAVGGAADGLTSTDIGVLELGTTPIGQSLQLNGSGSDYLDFTWTAPATETPGACNTTQSGPAAVPPFFNEIHYDNTGTDVGEFIEVAGTPGTDLTGWSIVLYNGSGGAPYGTIGLSGTLPTSCPGLGVQSTAIAGIQNGAPDGMALVDDMGTVIQFLSYEGAFTAVGGAADGLTSTDIGVLELGTTPIGQSLQLTGTGSASADFTWTGPIGETAGFCNTGQSGSAGGSPTLSIDDVSMTEGDVGTTIYTFTVSLSSAAAGDVTFDIATADNTALTGDNDYVANSLTMQTITAGNTSYSFDVTVNGDTTVEPDESFFVNLSNASGATVGDAQGEGTIVNDDFVITPIHDIQGTGSSSPLNGNVVVTRGVVTGIKSNGYFMQEPDASIDADPQTSEGIFVFTSAAPPAAAALGNLVQVSATVTEYTPSADPFQPPLTELSFATTTMVSAGNPLPAPIPLTTSFPDPAGPFDQLESLEGMRVSVASMTVTSGTEGTTNETNATGSNNGVFHGVVSGLPRSLREAGIQPPDPSPAGTIPPIPRWDGNPELLRVDSDGLVGQPQLVVASGQTITGLTGPLDYGFRRYTVLPDGSTSPNIAGPATSVAVSAPLPTEVTIASYNLERFFDDVDDPAISEPVLTALAYANRLNKASLGIRNELQTPDIVGLVEVENINALQDLATKISNDAVAAMQPDPQYVAYLVEGNDVGGIDVGFLVKTAPVTGGLPRVAVNTVVQELAGSLFTNPDTSTVLLNDRPPLRLDAVVNNGTGQTYPLTVIVNHLRSLSSATDAAPGPNGWATNGDRVRAKRQAQAEDLANLVQARQVLDPNEHIVLVGDFNAFEFNDGLGDSMNTIAGTPTPDNETAVTGDGADLVSPDLVNLFDTVSAGERYSFSFGGIGQSLDHALVNAAVLASTTAPRIEHARLNAGFPEVDRNDPMTARRLSDHDPLVVYLAPNGFTPIDVSISKLASGDPVIAGAQVTYTISVDNAGPQPALNTVWNDTLPAGTRFAFLSGVAGWTCTTPAVNATGTINCSNASVPVGNSVFDLVLLVDSDVPESTLISNTASVTTASPESNSTNNLSTAQVSVGVSANLSIFKLATAPLPLSIGAPIIYTLMAFNGGPSDVVDAVVTDILPANLSYVSNDCGASFTAPTLTWNIGALTNGGSATCNLSVTVSDVGTITNTATIASSAGDPNPGNNAGSSTLGGATLADLSIALGSNAPSTPEGLQYIYTVTTTNSGPSSADNLAFNLLVTGPAELVSSDCGAMATGNNLSWALPSLGFGASSTCQITMAVTATGTINASVNVLAATPDPDVGNNSADLSVFGTSVAPLPTLNQLGLLLLGVLLAGLGALATRPGREESAFRM